MLVASSCSISSREEIADSVSAPFQNFTALREYYVSAKGEGSGKSKSDPTSLNKAIQDSKPGDLFWLLPDTYTGNFVLNNPGKSLNPIVYRSVPGSRTVIHGSIQVRGAYNWIWGLEITDPDGISKEAGITLFGPGMRAINNVIHNQAGKGGINAWSLGSGQVIYGNIVYGNGAESGGHNLYVQNDFAAFGYKYILNNMFLDSADVCAKCFNVHAYAKEGALSGLYLEKNIIKNGRFLIGGYGDPADRGIVKENYFYKSRVQFGYRRPVQVEFEKNYLARSSLLVKYFWGAGEIKYKQTAPNVFRTNQILLPPGPHIEFTTSAYSATGRCEGCPAIRSEDIFDENLYSEPFQATFFANNNNLRSVNFAQWKSATADAGNSFDVKSKVIQPPLMNKVVVLPNAYEPGRIYIAVFNWEKRSAVTVDISDLVPAETSYKIYDAKSFSAAPLFSAISPKPADVPMGDQEFAVVVLVR